MLMEKFRNEQNLETSRILQNIDFSDVKTVKQLYNYDLAGQREMSRVEKETKSDFLSSKAKPDPLMVLIVREMENKIKYANMVNRKKHEKQALVIENAKKYPEKLLPKEYKQTHHQSKKA